MDRAANREVIDRDLASLDAHELSAVTDFRLDASFESDVPKGTPGVNDEKAAESNSRFLDENAIVLGDVHILIGTRGGNII